jgi:uncharacterized protein (DUF2235 family)
MSITRIIGGKLTKTATGNIDIHATNGNVNLVAATHNNWHGEENGILHHDYEPLHPEDKMSNRLELTLNLFFDGTANNRSNTESREKNMTAYQDNSNKKDDSYENDYTNIARGYDAISTIQPKKLNASKPLKVYVEGVGTTDLQKDDALPMGIAERAIFWNTGIKDKVKRGCELGAIEVSKATDGKRIDQLIINVYGFSRGAATARYFLNITNDLPYKVKVSKDGYFILPGDMMPQKYPKNEDKTKPPYPDSFEVKAGYFGRSLANKGVFDVGKIVYNFVGLYDTVSSHGLSHENDVKDLGLDAIKKAKMVLQLSSADEYRENFDLTNIESAGLKGLELTLPGVHSDIGGSYIACATEHSVVYIDSYTETRDENNKLVPDTRRAAAFKKILVKEGWYKEKELAIEVRYDRNEIYLVGTRILENAYDKIALNKMILVSKQFGVIYDDIITKQKTNISDSFVASVFRQLTKYTQAVMTHRNEAIRENKSGPQYVNESKQIKYLDYINPDDVKELRNRYLHWSVKADEFGLEPRFKEILPEEKRKRQIHHG